MSEDKPTLRELWQLKKDFRDTPVDDEQAQGEAWRAFTRAESKAGFLKGFTVYLSD